MPIPQIMGMLDTLSQHARRSAWDLQVPPSGRPLVEPEELLDPADVGLLGVVGEVADAGGLSDLVQELHRRPRRGVVTRPARR